MATSVRPESADIRIRDVSLDNAELTLSLMDGRRISAPLAWFPRLLHATQAQRARWAIAGGGYGVHWPGIDEDLSVEGLLRGARPPAPFDGLSDPPARSR